MYSNRTHKRFPKDKTRAVFLFFLSVTMILGVESVGLYFSSLGKYDSIGLQNIFIAWGNHQEISSYHSWMRGEVLMFLSTNDTMWLENFNAAKIEVVKLVEEFADLELPEDEDGDRTEGTSKTLQKGMTDKPSRGSELAVEWQAEIYGI
jgi:hypothetical protein